MKKYTMSLIQTEIAIKQLKDFFEKELAKKLSLTRVSAPLFVEAGTGINDDLNGTERYISFESIAGHKLQIIHSLAKRKRLALQRYGFKQDQGIYTDMNAIRRDEDLDEIHSYYVDQRDREKIIKKTDRTEKKLQEIVQKIYSVLQKTEKFINKKYDFLQFKLPKKIKFISTQELEDLYPKLSPKQREYEICKKHKAVFLMQIGGKLKSGIPHDGRAPDYDDRTLNGDILVRNPITQDSFEISSMGIRVDEKTMETQLKLAGCEDRKKLLFHKLLLDGKLPYTIGGGIGQSRLCMFYLEKKHIGQVQSSVWEKSDYEKFEDLL